MQVLIVKAIKTNNQSHPCLINVTMHNIQPILRKKMRKTKDKKVRKSKMRKIHHKDLKFKELRW